MAENKKNSIEKINMFLQLYSEEQLVFLESIMNIYANGIVNKKSIIDLSFSKERIQKCDTAIPYDYEKEVKKVLPNFNNHNYVYDYSKNIHGELINIYEELHIKLHTCLNSSNFDKL